CADYTEPGPAGRGRWRPATAEWAPRMENRMRLLPLLLLPLLLLPLLAAAAPSAGAADPTLEALLKAADLPYEIDEDGDYAIVIEWSQEKRSQLVYVSGTIQDLDDTRLYSVFSPAK